MTLSVAHPDRLGKLAEEEYWIYADEDIADYARVAHEYGAARRLLEPSALQAAISVKTGEFLCWVDNVLAASPPHYWIVAAAFKDVGSTPMLLHLACLLAALDGAEKGRSVVIVTRSAILAAQAVALGGRRRSGATAWWVDAFRHHAKAWVHWLIRPAQLYLRCVLANRLLGPDYCKKLERVQILVDTFFFAEDFETDGRYKDRFWPGLAEWYGAQGVRVAVMPYTCHLPLRKMPAAYRRMRHGTTLFVLGEYFLGVADCMLGAWHALRAFLRPPAFSTAPFCAVSVSLLALHWWRVSALQSVTYQIWKRVPRNMSRRGLTPDYVLDWYENQPLDKAVYLGFAKDRRQTRVIAGRQFFPAAGIVNIYSTMGEIRAGAAPTLNWACGKRIAELFARHDRLGKYEVVPALRYAHLFENINNLPAGRKLVVFLTSSLQESTGVLECVFAAGTSAWSRFESVVVKNHQAVDGALCKQMARRWPAMREPRVRWDQRATRNLLDEAALVVTGGSSVALEAICRGVPVIISGRSAGVSFNILETVDQRLWRLAYGPCAFEELVRDWLPHVPDQAVRREIGRQIRDEYFEPVTSATMRAFDPRRIDDAGQGEAGTRS